MTSRTPLLEAFTAGLACVIVLVATGVIAVTRANAPSGDGYPVVARFTDDLGQGLTRSSPVRIRGLEVGEVTGIELGPDGRAEVSLWISREVRIPRSAAVSVEPMSMFGPRAVDLHLAGDGSAGPFVAAGEVIDRTATSQQLDAIISRATELFEAIDGGAIRRTLASLADGLDGGGDDIARTIDGLDEVTAVLHQRRAATTALVTDLHELTSTFADRGPALVGAASSLRRSLPVLVETEAGLARTLDEVTRAGGIVADTFADQREAFGPLIDGLTRTTALLDRRLAEVAQHVGLLEEFFRMFASVMRLPRADGTVDLAVDLIVPDRICDLLQECKELVPDELRDLIDVGDVLDPLGEALDGVLGPIGDAIEGGLG